MSWISHGRTFVDLELLFIQEAGWSAKKLILETKKANFGNQKLFEKSNYFRQ